MAYTANSKPHLLTSFVVLIALILFALPCSAQLSAGSAQANPASLSAAMPGMDCPACCGSSITIDTPALCCVNHAQPAALSTAAAAPALSQLRVASIVFRLDPATPAIAAPGKTPASLPPPRHLILRI